MSPVRETSFGSGSSWPVAITIPARDEARRIRSCLDAAARALARRGGIVVMVNGSRDETHSVVSGWFAATGAPGIVIDEPNPPRGAGVGYARRRAVDVAMKRLAAGGMMTTTDADSTVAPDWIDANLEELRGADLICGRILTDPGERASLSDLVEARAALEGEYLGLTLAVMDRLDPVPHDPRPDHVSAPGASLAFRRPLYEDVGGIPDLVCREDREFAERADARGWRVRHSSRARITTSCRMTGRTGGGMADTLRRMSREEDPEVDEFLEPARATVLRASLRGELRRLWDTVGPSMATALVAPGLEPGDRFAPTWARIEASRADLRRRRMRLSDLSAELPVLRGLAFALTPDAACVAAE